MNQEEQKYLDEVLNKLKSFEEILEKYNKEIENNEKYDKDSKVKEKIDKDLFINRGRLINYYKNNKNKLDELYNKYQLYLNIQNTLDKEENELYTVHNKINDIKNFIINNENDIDQEYELLELINNSIDNLDTFKEKYNEYGNKTGLNKLVSVNKTYKEELKKHKENINSRYSNEFVHRKTKLFSMFTMLPKAIGLAIEKVKVCIKERKEAKENLAIKDRTNNLLKSLGQVIATPFVFTGKYVIDHWYLLLLLLLGKKDKLKRRKDRKEKEEEKNNDLNKDEVPVAVLETEKENAKEFIPETITEPVLKPVGSPVVAIEDEKNLNINPETSKKSSHVVEKTFDNLDDYILKIKNSKIPQYKVDEYLQGKELPIKKDLPSVNNGDGPIDISGLEKFVKEINNGINNYTLREIKPEEIRSISETCKAFISYLEERSGFNYFVLSNHPDVKVVHSKEEFASLTGCSPDAAERLYQSTQGLTSSEKTILWPEQENGLHLFENERELADHIQSREDAYLTDYYDRYVASNSERIKESLGNIPLGSEIVISEEGKYYVKGTDIQVDSNFINNTGVNPTTGLLLSLFTIGGTPSAVLTGLPIIQPVLVP